VGLSKSLALRPLLAFLYQPQMIGEGDCGAIGGMKTGRGNWSTLRKPAPAPLCPPQMPLDQTRARTRVCLFLCDTHTSLRPPLEHQRLALLQSVEALTARASAVVGLLSLIVFGLGLLQSYEISPISCFVCHVWVPWPPVMRCSANCAKPEDVQMLSYCCRWVEIRINPLVRLGHISLYDRC
jgi:hypothetical protein